MRSITFLAFSVLFIGLTHAQTELFKKDNQFTRQDSLRGSITTERVWWDLLHYDLSVQVDIDSQFIRGTNLVRYRVTNAQQVMQVDLQAPMKLVSAVQKGKRLMVRSEGNAHFIELVQKQQVGSTQEISLQFEGKPRVAKNAPWDGGFTWTKDSNGKPFVANSNQGIGASVWWPNKDHGYDEPDNGATLRLTVPEGLVAVGNGRLIETIANNGTRTFVWKVINPINNYGLNVNIGDYVNFSEKYAGEKGELDLDYWVLRENEAKAREQFKEVPRTLAAFEHWFGPYPFYEDSYKLVEVPYLGMEHQSSVTYGNNYKNGYNGRNRVSFDWSGTGIGLKWDYIIVHETGHEWFANNITAKDVADMWVHEGFTAYSESLFVEYFFGKEDGSKYTIGTRQRLSNSEPIIGTYHVNKEGSGDMYFKGNNLLHTLRQVIANDDLWRSILRGLNQEFYHQTVTTAQVENYIATKASLDLKPFFDQYLRDHRVPKLEYKVNDGAISYRWADVIDSFDMPIDVAIDGNNVRLKPTIEWKTTTGSTFVPDINYYVLVQEVN